MIRMLFIIFGIISISTKVPEADIFVGKSKQFKTIQQAIDQAPEESSIFIEPGVYNENIKIQKPISISGLKSDTSCILLISKPQSPAIYIKSDKVKISNIRIENSNQSSVGTGIMLDGVKNCIIRNNWIGYLGPFLEPVLVINEATMNKIDSNFLIGSAHTNGITINSSKQNTINSNIMDYGWELINFIGCDTIDNTLFDNTLQRKNMSGRLKSDSTTNGLSLRIRTHDLTGKEVIKYINPSGWDDQGKLLYRQIWDFCSHTSNTIVTRYWEIGFGGSNQPTYAIVKDSISLNTLWSKLRIAPAKPTIDFGKSWIVLIQPGETVTQYNYRVDMLEENKSIKFDVQEYHTEKAKDILLSQESIIAYEIPITKKNIKVNIQRCKGSEGPYLK